MPYCYRSIHSNFTYSLILLCASRVLYRRQQTSLTIKVIYSSTRIQSEHSFSSDPLFIHHLIPLCQLYTVHPLVSQLCLMCGSTLNCQTLCLAARPRYSLVVDEDVKKPTNQPPFTLGDFQIQSPQAKKTTTKNKQGMPVFTLRKYKNKVQRISVLHLGRIFLIADYSGLSQFFSPLYFLSILNITLFPKQLKIR